MQAKQMTSNFLLETSDKAMGTQSLPHCLILSSPSLSLIFFLTSGGSNGEGCSNGASRVLWRRIVISSCSSGPTPK